MIERTAEDARASSDMRDRQQAAAGMSADRHAVWIDARRPTQGGDHDVHLVDVYRARIRTPMVGRHGGAIGRLDAKLGAADGLDSRAGVRKDRCCWSEASAASNGRRILEHPSTYAVRQRSINVSCFAEGAVWWRSSRCRPKARSSCPPRFGASSGWARAPASS